MMTNVGTSEEDQVGRKVNYMATVTLIDKRKEIGNLLNGKEPHRP